MQENEKRNAEKGLTENENWSVHGDRLRWRYRRRKTHGKTLERVGEEKKGFVKFRLRAIKTPFNFPSFLFSFLFFFFFFK